MVHLVKIGVDWNGGIVDWIVKCYIFPVVFQVAATFLLSYTFTMVASYTGIGYNLISYVQLIL